MQLFRGCGEICRDLGNCRCRSALRVRLHGVRGLCWGVKGALPGVPDRRGAGTGCGAREGTGALCALPVPRGRWALEATHPGCWRAGAPGERGEHSTFLRRSQGGGGVSPRSCSVTCEMMCVFSLPGRMFIFYGNKTSTQFLNFTPTLICSDGLQADILGPVSPTPVTGGHGDLEEGWRKACAAVGSGDLRTLGT